MQKVSNEVVVLTAVHRSDLRLLIVLGHKPLNEHPRGQANRVLGQLRRELPRQVVVRRRINLLAMFVSSPRLHRRSSLELLNSGLH